MVARYGAQRRRDHRQQALGHGVDHPGAGEDAGEHPGGEDQRDHCENVLGVCADALLLLLDARVVDDHGDAEGDHEQNRHRQQAGDQGRHQDHGENSVEPQQLGPARLRILRHADLRQVLMVGGQVQLAETGALALAVDPGDGEDRQQPGDHRRDHRHEDIRRVDVQGTRRAGGGATPGVMLEHAAGEHDQAGHHQRAHAQAAVQRQYGGHADHVGGRAVAVEGDDHRQRRGAQRDLQRVALTSRRILRTAGSNSPESIMMAK